jgi:hypothetical protein
MIGERGGGSQGPFYIVTGPPCRASQRLVVARAAVAPGPRPRLRHAVLGFNARASSPLFLPGFWSSLSGAQ